MLALPLLAFAAWRYWRWGQSSSDVKEEASQGLIDSTADDAADDPEVSHAASTPLSTQCAM